MRTMPVYRRLFRERADRVAWRVASQLQGEWAVGLVVKSHGARREDPDHREIERVLQEAIYPHGISMESLARLVRMSDWRAERWHAFFEDEVPCDGHDRGIVFLANQRRLNPESGPFLGYPTLEESERIRQKRRQTLMGANLDVEQRIGGMDRPPPVIVHTSSTCDNSGFVEYLFHELDCWSDDPVLVDYGDLMGMCELQLTRVSEAVEHLRSQCRASDVSIYPMDFSWTLVVGHRYITLFRHE